MPAASAPVAAAAPADEPAAAEKPAEKTVFNVKLESFDAAAKAKVIREVKAMIPNLTLIDVRPNHINKRELLLTLTFCSRLRNSSSHYRKLSRRTFPRRTRKNCKSPSRPLALSSN